MKLATWMDDLELLDQPFYRLRVPGTHNSSTHELHGTDPLSSPFSKLTVPVYYLFPFVFRLWSRCQSLGVRAQLEAGVRFLDLRVARRSDGSITTAHTFRAAALRGVLDDIADFYDAHGTSEVVVVSVKFDSANKATMQSTEARQALRDAVAQHRVSAYLSRGRSDPLTAPLRAHGGTPLVLLLHDAMWAPGGPGYAAPGYYAKWFNTNDPERLRADVAAAVDATRDRQTMAVIQNILTPRAHEIILAVVLYIALALAAATVVGLGLAAAVAGPLSVLRSPVAWGITVASAALVGGLALGGATPSLLWWSHRANDGAVAALGDQDYNVLLIDDATPAVCEAIIRGNKPATTETV